MYKEGKYENIETAINVIVDGIHKFHKEHLAKFQLRSILECYLTLGLYMTALSPNMNQSDSGVTLHILKINFSIDVF